MNTLIFSIILPIVLFALGVLTGLLIKGSYKEVGKFVINENDPTKPAFWLHLEYDLDVLERQKVLGLRVSTHSLKPTDSSNSSL
jgi:hypothetical protein